MAATATELEQRIAAFAAHNAAADKEFNAILARARETNPDDREAAALLLDAARAVGRCAQAREGQLIQLIAQADRVKAHRAGLATWLATNLDVSPGKARGIAESAKHLGNDPTLTEHLSSGDIGSDTIRALTRTAKAVAHTTLDKSDALVTTLTIAAREGATAARSHVRILEETLDPGSSEKLLAKQRRRSFARTLETDSGMVRVEALLDPQRATTLHAAIDLFTADVIRTRQYDHRDTVAPRDVRTTEQIQAHALTRFAEVFLTADPQTRGARFNVPMLFHSPLIPDATGLAESVYGTLVPVSGLEDCAVHVVEHHDAEPILYDGKPVNLDPNARLASLQQRIALAFRDRHCTYPGCTRPPTWALHAHHKTPHSKGGKTTTANLALYCAEHHTLVHREDQSE